MPMRIHELHPSLVHLPLTLLPAAASVDLFCSLQGNRALDRFGKGLWLAGVLGGGAAGLAGLAASQEVSTDDPKVRDTVFRHGLGNALIVTASAFLTRWRWNNKPTLWSALAGLGACGAALYTAYLGGELVYGYGVGVKAPRVTGDAQKSPPLFSREAPKYFVRDAAGGTKWLARRLGGVLSRRQKLAAAATNV